VAAGATELGQRAQQVLVPLLPDEPAHRQHEVPAALRRRRRARGGEAVDVDAGRADHHPLGRCSLEEQRVAGAGGRRHEQVGRRQHVAPVAPRAHVAVGVEQRQRLPDRQHELEAELVAQPRGLP
jgi:hypothetical protein